jgi:HEAT repeat protein
MNTFSFSLISGLLLGKILLLPSTCLAQDSKEPEHDGKLLSEWVKQIKSDDPKSRYQALNALAQMGPRARTATPAVLDVVKDRDPIVRAVAVRCLPNIGRDSPAVATALVHALFDEDDYVRKGAFNGCTSLAPEALGPLLEALKHKDVAVRTKVAEVFAATTAPHKSAVPALITALNDKEKDVRLHAAVALTRIGAEAKAAVPALIEAFKDRETPGMRIWAARALLEVGPATDWQVDVVLPILVEVLRKDNHDIRAPSRVEDRRIKAATLLGSFGPAAKAAIPDLIAAVNETRNESPAAVEALGKIGPEAKSAIPAIAAFLRKYGADATCKALAQIGPDAVPALTEAMLCELPKPRSPFEPIDVKAAAVLDTCGFAAEALITLAPKSKDALPAVMKALRDKDPRRVPPIARAVARQGPGAKELVPALVDALKGIKGVRDDEVRFLLATALEKIGPDAKSALPDLIALVKESKQYPMAIFAIRGIGPDAKEAIPVLVEVLCRPNFEFSLIQVHEVAREILAKLEAKPADVLKGFGQALRNPDARMNVAGARNAMQQALEHLSPTRSADAALQAALKEKDADIVLGTVTVLMGTRSGADGVKALCELLKHDDPQLRQTAAVALHNYREGPPAVVAALRDALQDKDKRVRGQAATSLGGMGKAAAPALPDLAELREVQLKDATQGNAATWALQQIRRGKTPPAVSDLIEVLGKQGSAALRAEAAFDLGQHGPKAREAVPALLKALEDRDADVRASAAHALGAIGPEAKAALPRLREALKDRNPRVGRFAQNALTKIEPDPVKKSVP